MRIKRNRIVLLFFVVIATLAFINNVNARGGVFCIKPKQEIIETVDLTTEDSVSGSVLVHGGTVDFYVKERDSQNVLLTINSTSSSNFNFTKIEDGFYTMHIVNPSNDSSLSVTLDYSIKFDVELALNVVFTANAGVMRVAVLFWKPKDNPLDSWDIVFRRVQEVFVIGPQACKTLAELISTLRNGMPLFYLLIGLIFLFPSTKRYA